MPYDIHIRRSPPLTLAEWKAAVEATVGVRLNISENSIVNPKTGDVITIGGVDGDAQVKVGQSWRSCFHWNQSGSVAFRAPSNFNNSKSRLRRIARELTERLGAKLVGDDGEVYD